MHFKHKRYDLWSVLLDRVKSLKMYRNLNPGLLPWNAVFNKSNSWGVVVKRDSEQCNCFGCNRWSQSCHIGDFFSPPLEIISHETISTFFMSNERWLQRNWRQSCKRVRKKDHWRHERQNIISCRTTEHVSASMRSLCNWKQYLVESEEQWSDTLLAYQQKQLLQNIGA